MGQNSKIEWTDHTWNPWEGCTKVSPGCTHCYAESRANRYGTVKWGKGEPRRRTSAANWKKPLQWNTEAQASGVQALVFCASLADVFDPEVHQEWRNDLWEVVRSTPWLRWLILSKRFGKLSKADIMAMLPQDWWEGYANVVLGATVENQHYADIRVPALLDIPSAFYFLSCEPLLDAVDLTSLPANLETLSGKQPEWDYFNALTGRTHDSQADEYGADQEFRKIDWVICGGESGAGSRAMHPKWARSLRDQCITSDVAFLFKQWGEWVAEEQSPLDICLPGQSFAIFAQQESNGDWTAGDQTAFYKVGKKKSGRLLDGEEWNQYPQKWNEQPTL